MEADWKDAPEWANYAAFDKDGRLCFYENKPHIEPKLSIGFIADDGRWQRYNHPDWKNSLRCRYDIKPLDDAMNDVHKNLEIVNKHDHRRYFNTPENAKWRAEFIQKGVDNLLCNGMAGVNTSNILTNKKYCPYFITFLRFHLDRDHGAHRHSINMLIAQIEANNA